MKITEIFFYQNIRYFFGLILKITKHNCFVQSGFYLHILGLNIIVLDYQNQIQLMQGQEILENRSERRIARIGKMIQDEKYQLLQKIKRICQGLLASKKYRQYRDTLEQRIKMVDRFVHEITNTFFTLLSDEEFLCLTTEIDLVEKIDRFKKYMINSIQKITVNISNRNQCFRTMIERQQEEGRSRLNKRKTILKKSKNSKMSNQTSMVMTEWLLKNFENPYPTTQQKVKMSKESNISVIQVNNWFINARERTIKGYFNRDC